MHGQQNIKKNMLHLLQTEVVIFVFRKSDFICCGNHMKHITTLRSQNSTHFDVRARCGYTTGLEKINHSQH